MIYTAIFVVVGLLAGSIFAIWKAHVEAQAEQAVRDHRLRQRGDAAMGVYPPNLGHKQQWRDRRKVS